VDRKIVNTAGLSCWPMNTVDPLNKITHTPPKPHSSFILNALVVVLIMQQQISIVYCAINEQLMLLS